MRSDLRRERSFGVHARRHLSLSGVGGLFRRINEHRTKISVSLDCDRGTVIAQLSITFCWNNSSLHYRWLGKLTVFGHVFLRIGYDWTVKESTMLNLDITTQYAGPPKFGMTLWHCGRCDAFISIRSAQLLEGVFCPVCGEVVLEFCGRLSSMPCIQFGDA